MKLIIRNTGSSMPLRVKLLIAFILLILFVIGTLSAGYFSKSKSFATELASKNAYEIVKKNNDIIDSTLSKIKEGSLSLILDQELFRLLSKGAITDDYELGQLDKQVTKILNQYFLTSGSIYSVQLATSGHWFGSGFLPEDGFSATKIYQTALEGEGKLIWVPTYEFAEMYNRPDLKDSSIDFKFLFSAVQKTESVYLNNGIFTPLDKRIERPVLLVNFKENIFYDLMNDSIPIKGSEYFVVSPSGVVVSDSNRRLLGQKLDEEWLVDVIARQSGTTNVVVNGRKSIVCFDTSAVTGWTTLVIIPNQSLMASFLTYFQSYTLYLTLFLFVLAVFLSFFISEKITTPLKNLIKAIRRTSEGQFETKIPEQGGAEIGLLILKYNQMNERIQQLIDENYEAKLREKEAEIKALNLQLDPHFMYNTLNIVNLIAMENDQDEISNIIVNLSGMLKYTAKNNAELVSLEEDMKYLKNYVFIMGKRFIDLFEIIIDFDERILRTKVPKFFLQPFVENAIIHGFARLRTGGRIVVSGRSINEERIFVVTDNGTGIEIQRLQSLLEDERSVGIQNVYRRIRLQYGHDYGVRIESSEEGTTVTVNLPEDNSI